MDLPSSSCRDSMSASSVYTTTSSSTQWGPGALSGKAILAMGKAVVRSADYLVISRRLSAMKAVLPCSDDHHSHHRGLETMCDDLLELSRPGLYRESFRTQAMQLIVAQIAAREISHLLLSISKWEVDHEELVAILSEIIGVGLFSKRGFSEPDLVHSYTTALPNGCHPWLPCVDFVSKIAQLNNRIFQAVMGARFLETILWVFAAQKQGARYDGTLKNECEQAFKILSHSLGYDLWTESISNTCPIRPSPSLVGMVNSVTTQHLWPVVERRLLEIHAKAMLNIISHLTPCIGATQDGRHGLARDYYYFFDVNTSRRNDFFNGGSFFYSDADPILSARVAQSFLRCVGLGGDVDKPTVDHLSCLSYPKKVKALTLIIQHLIAQSMMNPSSVEPSEAFAPGNSDFSANIVRFLVDISVPVQSISNALSDAILLNILPFIGMAWEAATICEDIFRRTYSPFRLGRDSCPSYRAHTLNLVDTIRSSGLSAVVDEASRTESWVHLMQPLFSGTPTPFNSVASI
ncbi:hypothetical protein DFH06DRAFT_1305376 [Mycena polygramma]|nr:hypothetical protein DFH06DRAFT_1305376 [Mycena polygramma]